MAAIVKFTVEKKEKCNYEIEITTTLNYNNPN